MLRNIEETDQAEKYAERYSQRWHRGERSRAAMVERIVANIRYARSFGIDEDLAVGVGLLAFEQELSRDFANHIRNGLPGGIPFEWMHINRAASPTATRHVAQFLRHAFAPALIFRLAGWLAGNPVRPGRTKAEYVSKLTDLLAAWPNLPRPVTS